jgi:hypothetical protein
MLPHSKAFGAVSCGPGTRCAPAYFACFDSYRTYAVGVLSLRQSGTLHFNVCGFSTLRAEKPHTNDR